MIFAGVVAIETLLVIAFTTLILVFYALLKRVPESRLTNKELPFITVIVPARNEEGKIARCLESLAKQNYPNYEVVVINDRSTDRTGEVIEKLAKQYPVIKPLQGMENPDGWIGKCNAIVQAMAHASGEWVLFTDADTCHSVDSLRKSISYAIDNQCDLISFVPLQELGSFWERLIMPVLLGSFLCGDPFHTVNIPTASRAYAYGQYVLVRRSTYLLVGGHQSVRDEIVEDHALARAFKSKGYRILVADGKDLYGVRMYTDLESLWMGWTKNLYSLIECRPIYLILVVLLINCAVIGPFVETIRLVAMALVGATGELFPELVLSVILQMAALVLMYKVTSEHHAGVDWRHFFLIPAGSVAVSALFLCSAYHVFSGSQVNWKGRRYRVNSSKTIQTVGPRGLESALEKAGEYE